MIKGKDFEPQHPNPMLDDLFDLLQPSEIFPQVSRWPSFPRF